MPGGYFWPTPSAILHQAPRRASDQAKSQDEIYTLADAMSLLDKIVMASNINKMQTISSDLREVEAGRWRPNRSRTMHPTLTAERLIVCGIFHFPIELYLELLLYGLAQKTKSLSPKSVQAGS